LIFAKKCPALQDKIKLQGAVKKLSYKEKVHERLLSYYYASQTEIVPSVQSNTNNTI
jgi:hypothetical protein